MTDEIDSARPAEHSSKSRRERGIRAYARIFGVTATDLPAAMAARVGPLFAKEAFASAGGPAWSHPDLTPRDRSRRAGPSSGWPAGAVPAGARREHEAAARRWH